MTTTETQATPPPATLGAPAGTFCWGGAGGFVFVASVVAQNVMRGATAPANDATAAKIVSDYADHRALHWALAALFVVGACALAAFVAELWDRLGAGAAGTYVRIGVFGTTLVAALFSMTVALDVTLAAYVHIGHASPDVVRALWVLHNGVFALLLGALAIALFGLSLAAVTGGLVGRAWRTVGVVGSLALLSGALAAPAITEGNPVMVVALFGFLAWLSFVGRASYTLWSERG